MADIIVTLQREDEGYSVIQESGYSLNFPYVPLYRTLVPAVIPSCACWFNPLTIHQVEVDSLPEYFNEQYPSKTPAVYMTYRNFIIKLYRDKPTCYLTATQCRRVLTGDACSIIRVHAFLEHWGIINLFATKPYTTPSYDFAWPGHMSYGKKRIFELGRPFCECCGNICGVIWMKFGDQAENPKENTEISKEINICAECFEIGRFPEAWDMEKFVQENLLTHFKYSELVNSEGWNEKSTAELISALKRHGEDWDRVAEALGKEKRDVINKYLSLPMQELIEAENEKFVDYENPLRIKNTQFHVDIDFLSAMENSKIARVNEEIEIDRILNQMIEIQAKKIEIKSRYISEMKSLLDLQTQSAKLKLQQLMNQHTILAKSKGTHK